MSSESQSRFSYKIQRARYIENGKPTSLQNVLWLEPTSMKELRTSSPVASHFPPRSTSNFILWFVFLPSWARISSAATDIGFRKSHIWMTGLLLDAANNKCGCVG